MSPQENIYRGIILLTLRMRCSLGRVCESYDLTPVQGMVLIMLEPGQTITMNKLTCVLGCDASNTTGLVDRLEAQGMITRSKDPSDKRVTMIGLSKQGAKRRTELLQALAVADRLGLNELTNEQAAGLDSMLSKHRH